MKTLLLASKEQSVVDSVMVLFLNHNINCEYIESELKTKYYPTSSTQYWTNPKIVSENITVEFTGKGVSNVDDGLTTLHEWIINLSNGQSLSKDTLFDTIFNLSNGTAKQSTREQKIVERHEHDVKNGSTITLEKYQNFTSHSNLKQFFIDVEAVNL